MPPLNSDFCAELQNGVISLLQQKAIQLWFMNNLRKFALNLLFQVLSLQPDDGIEKFYESGYI
jgi:hypothetical protein